MDEGLPCVRPGRYCHFCFQWEKSTRELYIDHLVERCQQPFMYGPGQMAYFMRTNAPLRVLRWVEVDPVEYEEEEQWFVEYRADKIAKQATGVKKFPSTSEYKEEAPGHGHLFLSGTFD